MPYTLVSIKKQSTIYYTLCYLPPHPPPRIPLKKQLKINCRWKWEALKELLENFANNWLPRLKPAEKVKPINKVSAVRDHIAAVNYEEICC